MESTFRVYLRKPTPKDIEELEAAYQRSRDLHLPYSYAPEHIEDYVAQSDRYLVCLKDTKAIVGTFNISAIVRGWFQSAYLGYEVFAPYQQQGLMYQGLLLLLEEAFR